jgi:RNA polymerase-binding transcription factor DksA
VAKKAKKTTKKATVKKTAKKKAVAKKTVKKKAAVKKATAKKKVAKKKAVAKKTVKKKTVAKKKTTKKATVKKTAKKTIKKTAAPKKPASVKGVPVSRKRPKTILKKAELQRFRELLIEKLKEIVGNVNHIELESLKKSRMDASGDLSSMPIHMADVGSDNYEQEFALGLMDSERKIVMEIQAALKRIENNSYGICEGTFEPIPKPRLEGIPWTRYCVQYAEMLEKGLVVAEQNWYDDEDDDDVIKDEELDKEELGVDYDDDDYDDDDEEEDDIEDLYFGFNDED